MLSALFHRQWEEAEVAAQNLLTWLRKDGFPPNVTTLPADPEWSRTMAEFGCIVCLRRVRTEKARHASEKGS